MRASTLLSFSLLSIALPFGALARDSAKARAHHEIAMRNSGNATTTALNKRGTFSNARFTWYDVTDSTTSCEDNPSPSDYVVALNVEQYGSYWYSTYCHKEVTISYGGKTAVAKIVDECMGCPYGALDFSTGLFQHFAGLDVGEMYGSWYFTGDGGGSGDNTPTTTKHTTSTTHHTTKTTTKEDPTTTSTHTTHTTTKEKTTSTSTEDKTSSTESSTTTKATPTKTPSSSSTIASSTAVDTAVPSDVATQSGSSVIAGLTEAIIDMSGLAAAAASL